MYISKEAGELRAAKAAEAKRRDKLLNEQEEVIDSNLTIQELRFKRYFPDCRH